MMRKQGGSRMVHRNTYDLRDSCHNSVLFDQEPSDSPPSHWRVPNDAPVTQDWRKFSLELIDSAKVASFPHYRCVIRWRAACARRKRHAHLNERLGKNRRRLRSFRDELVDRREGVLVSGAQF
jgi:hypothetical protein